MKVREKLVRRFDKRLKQLYFGNPWHLVWLLGAVLLIIVAVIAASFIGIR